MKVAVIGTVGVPANYGGFETLVENLISYKRNGDIRYTVFCSSRAYDAKLKEYKGARLKYVPFKANGWQAIIYDNVSLLRSYFNSDVILSLGGNLYLLPVLRFLRRKRVRVINNFDGMDFSREKWSLLARKIIAIGMKSMMKNIDRSVADNEAIEEYIYDRFRVRSALIEYGGDNARVIRDPLALAEKYGLEAGKYAFKVARIEPENNIEMILEAFSMIPAEKLVVVGNWGRSQFGMDMRQKYSAYDNLVLMDPIYDEHDINMLRSNCRVYIHGHSVGGTNPSLVEAMSTGLCIISYDVKYNRVTTENKAAYFSSEQELVKVYSVMTPSLIESISRNMAEIADRRYRWQLICEKYEALY